MRKFKGTMLLTLLTLLMACNFDPSYKDESEGAEWESEFATLNQKEILFIDSLNKIGFNTKIERRIASRNEGLTYYLHVNCAKLYVSHSNIDSLESFRKELCNKLYSSVIQDDIVYEITDIFITMSDINYEKGVFEKEFFPLKKYYRDSLEKWNGFKVVKTGKDEFKRILLDNPSK